jgi:hypothetical protein
MNHRRVTIMRIERRISKDARRWITCRRKDVGSGTGDVVENCRASDTYAWTWTVGDRHHTIGKIIIHRDRNTAAKRGGVTKRNMQITTFDKAF